MKDLFFDAAERFAKDERELKKLRRFLEFAFDRMQKSDGPVEFTVAETPTSMWNYHLRLVADGKRYEGGGAPPALCGRKLGWDTKIPLTAYGHKDHIPSSWCNQCKQLAAELGVQVGKSS